MLTKHIHLPLLLTNLTIPLTEPGSVSDFRFLNIQLDLVSLRIRNKF